MNNINQTISNEQLSIIRKTKKLKCIRQIIEIKKNNLLALGEVKLGNSYLIFSSYKNFENVKSALLDFFNALGLYYTSFGEHGFNYLYNYYDQMAETFYKKRGYEIKIFEQFFKYHEFLLEMDIVSDIQNSKSNIKYIDKVKDLVKDHCHEYHDPDSGGFEGVWFSFPSDLSISKKYDEIVINVDFSNSKNIIFRIRAGTDINYARKIVAKHFLREKKNSRYYEMKVRKYFSSDEHFTRNYKKALKIFPNIDDSLFEVKNLKDEYFKILEGNIVLDKSKKNEFDYSGMKKLMNLIIGLKISLITSIIGIISFGLALFFITPPLWFTILFIALELFYILTSLVFVTKQAVSKIFWYFGIFGIVPILFISFYYYITNIIMRNFFFFFLSFSLFINLILFIFSWCSLGSHFKDKPRLSTDNPSHNLIVSFSPKRIYEIFGENDSESLDDTPQIIDAREFHKIIRFIIEGGYRNFEKRFNQIFKSSYL